MTRVSWGQFVLKLVSFGRTRKNAPLNLKKILVQPLGVVKPKKFIYLTLAITALKQAFGNLQTEPRKESISLGVNFQDLGEKLGLIVNVSCYLIH